MIIGIQGGKGSFNELALQDFCERNDLSGVQVKYLFTTEKVLQALVAGEITYGQFAIHNTLGGLVIETLSVLGTYSFQVVEHFSIAIRHNLMKLPSVSIKELTEIMAHEQVLKQCAGTLHKKYSHLEQKTGEGDLADTAAAAQALYEGKLPETTAILGNPLLADLYQLVTIATDLQDSADNRTTFLIVSRRE